MTQPRCPHPVALPARAIGELALQGPGPHTLTARTQHGPKQDDGEPGANAPTASPRHQGGCLPPRPGQPTGWL